MLHARNDRLAEAHVRPLMDLVYELRARGLDVPNMDPNDGGVNARALFLLKTPGPRAVGSRFVSRENPDPSARNMSKAAGFARSDVVIWNVVAHCVSTADRMPTPPWRAAVPDTQAFIDRLPNLAVVVFCGRSAQRAIPLLRLPSHVQVLSTFHPGAQSYNRLECRAAIHETFRLAKSEGGDPGRCYGDGASRGPGHPERHRPGSGPSTGHTSILEGRGVTTPLKEAMIALADALAKRPAEEIMFNWFRSGRLDRELSDLMKSRHPKVQAEMGRVYQEYLAELGKTRQ